MAETRLRQTKLGIYLLPTRAVRGLLEEGIDESNIDKYKAKELRKVEGFGENAENLLLAQRAKRKAANKRRHARSKESVTPARNMRMHDEAKGAGMGESRNPDAKAPSWLKMPGGEVEPSKTLSLEGNRLRIDIGKEHGFDKRHAIWVQNMVRNAPVEMGVGSVERLLVKIVRKAYADDYTKGGTIGLATMESFGERADATPVLKT